MSNKSIPKTSYPTSELYLRTMKYRHRCRMIYKDEYIWEVCLDPEFHEYHRVDYNVINNFKWQRQSIKTYSCRKDCYADILLWVHWHKQELDDRQPRFNTRDYNDRLKRIEYLVHHETMSNIDKVLKINAVIPNHYTSLELAKLLGISKRRVNEIKNKYL